MGPVGRRAMGQSPFQVTTDPSCGCGVTKGCVMNTWTWSRPGSRVQGAGPFISMVTVTGVRQKKMPHPGSSWK